MQKTLGGDRLGSERKIRLSLHNYERSSHNMSREWLSSVAPGVLTPCFYDVALNGDTWYIEMASNIYTLPTLGPMFGKFKAQVDFFSIPIRLYNRMLHNNMLGIGMKMEKVLFPLIRFNGTTIDNVAQAKAGIPIEERQISQSSLYAYLGIRGLGFSRVPNTMQREFNALGVIGYYDVVKNYYANKQEDNAYVIGKVLYLATGGTSSFGGKTTPINTSGLFNEPLTDILGPASEKWTSFGSIRVEFKDKELAEKFYKYGTIVYEIQPDGEGAELSRCKFYTTEKTIVPISAGAYAVSWKFEFSLQKSIVDLSSFGVVVTNVNLSSGIDEVELLPFHLKNIDVLRENILAAPTSVPYIINDEGMLPYCLTNSMVTTPKGYNNGANSPMAGLCVKTYLSDKFNNWINTEWIDGVDGISAITAVDTTSGQFTIDSLVLANKVYNLLNRIGVSGGTYDDWQEAVWGEDAIRKAESPVYMGGASFEIGFNEVVSTANTDSSPIGELAGRGTKYKDKGGNIKIKVKEPSILMAMFSITPRICYSQGNFWFNRLENMNELHKPALDGIGFQEMILEDMAFWEYDLDNRKQRSGGKQPAWLNYMTSVNQAYGTFANSDQTMFMTLNRRYERKVDTGVSTIEDLTTYIDPTKYNQIFADSSVTGQNFWVMLGFNVTARRKMSAKVMPNL